ncbi:MAG: ATP-binding protein [Actinomycetota bacterium]
MFDFDAQPTLDRRFVEDLATLRFVQERANLLLVGSSRPVPISLSPDAFGDGSILQTK